MDTSIPLQVLLIVGRRFRSFLGSSAALQCNAPTLVLGSRSVGLRFSPTSKSLTQICRFGLRSPSLQLESLAVMVAEQEKTEGSNTEAATISMDNHDDRHDQQDVQACT